MTYVWNGVAAAARQALVITLFLIGAGLTREVLGQVGVYPLLQGIILWFVVGAATLISLLCFGLA